MVSRSEAKRMHELWQRLVAWAMRRTEAFADIGDHLRALQHHYDEPAEKRPEIHITLEPQQHLPNCAPYWSSDRADRLSALT